jgi:hypothetical protein
VALVNYLDELAEGVAAGGRLEDILRAVAMRGKGLDTKDWRMRHRPPELSDEVSGSLSRLYNIYPEDVYTRPRIYASEPEELMVADIAKRVRDQDEALVDVYRAVPRWVSDIETGDWVTPSLGYARRHANIVRKDDTPIAILRGQARAGDLLSEGNSLAEFGYVGSPIRPASRLMAPRVPASLMQQAMTGDRAALEKVAKLYGLDTLAERV